MAKKKSFKKNDCVAIPKGSPFVRANPVLLDKSGTINGAIQYNGVGKVDAMRGNGIVSVAVWDAGRSFPWYANFKASDLRPTDYTLGYDSRRGVLTATTP